MAVSATVSEHFGGLSRSVIAQSLHPGRAESNGLVDRIQAMGRRLGGDVFRRQSLLERHDEHGQLAKIHCPTLVIASACDRLRTLDEANELRAEIPGATLEVLEGTGYMIPLEGSEWLTDTMARWLPEHVRTAHLADGPIGRVNRHM